MIVEQQQSRQLMRQQKRQDRWVFHAHLQQNQELVTFQSTGTSYWEGEVLIHGQSAGAPINGEGYVELTGYVH